MGEKRTTRRKENEPMPGQTLPSDSEKDELAGSGTFNGGKAQTCLRTHKKKGPAESVRATEKASQSRRKGERKSGKFALRKNERK